MLLTKNAEYILKSLEQAGYRADIVGGPVRDYLLGKLPSDYDITTSAHPEEVKEVFSAHKTVDTGIKHGTVTLVLDGEPYEITTWRVDGEYKDARHPESVTFTANIEDDLARRDFTVNAMAYGLDGSICDPFGGREDLSRRLIRAVGVPHERFCEDALRILRGIRFASMLEFEIESETASAMHDLAPLLHKISAERIYTEWMKLLSGSGAHRVIEEYRDIIYTFLPELDGMTLPPEESFNEKSPVLRQLALFASLDNPEDKYLCAMTRLKAPSAVRDDGVRVLCALADISVSTDAEIGRTLNLLGEKCTRELILLANMLGKCDVDTAQRLDSYIARSLPYRICDLMIGGRELMSLGITGKAVGDTLTHLLFEVIDGRVENDAASLIREAKNIGK